MLFRPLGIFQFLNGLVMFLGSLKFFNELDMLRGIFQFLKGFVVSPLGRLSLGILNPLNGFNLFRLGIFIFLNIFPMSVPPIPFLPKSALSKPEPNFFQLLPSNKPLMPPFNLFPRPPSRPSFLKPF